MWSPGNSERDSASVRRSNLRIVGAVLAFLAIAGACSSTPEVKRGVGVRTINTDIGLGINPDAAAAPANIVVQPRRPGIEQPPEITVPPLTLSLRRRR